MNLQSLPDTIQVILATAGGLGLRGAFVYVGASHFRYRCAEAEGEHRSDFESRLATTHGAPDVEFDVGLYSDDYFSSLTTIKIPQRCWGFFGSSGDAGRRASARHSCGSPQDDHREAMPGTSEGVCPESKYVSECIKGGRRSEDGAEVPE